MQKPARILIYISSFLVLTAMLYFFDQVIRNRLIMPAFLKHEEQMAQKDIIRCVQAVENEVYHLGQLTSDWAEWDDMYTFARDLNPVFAASSLEVESLSEVGINMILIISPEGKVLFNKVYGEKKVINIDLPELVDKSLELTHPFMRVLQSDMGKETGFLLTKYGPMMVAASKILTSDKMGPARGVLVMGRFLDEQLIEELNRQTQIKFSYSTPDFTSLANNRLELLSAPTGYIDVNSSTQQKLDSYAIIKDLYLKPVILLHAYLDRGIYQRGMMTARFTSATILSSLLLLVVLALGFFYLYRKKTRQQRFVIESLVEEKTAELSAATAQLLALSEAANEGLILHEGGVCLAMNKQARQMFGYEEKECLGKMTTELVVKEERKIVEEMILAKNTGAYETVALRSDNSTFPLWVSGKTVEYEGRTVRAVSLVDLTEKKRTEADRQLLEEKLKRSQKMESIGLMVGGVAHDLNNILSGVVTYPELILLGLDQKSELRKPIELIRESGKQAADVVADLLTVAKGIALVLEPVDVNRLILDYLYSAECGLLQNMHPQVKISTELMKQLPYVTGSVLHIKKCVMNIVTNSVEAIRGTGLVSITTQVVNIDENWQRENLKPGQYVTISVRDNGSGINPNDLNRIFEPFYSRKIKGRSGTGLGLAVVWNTMQDHNGTVTVDSDVNGTNFKMYLPVTRKELHADAEGVNIDVLRGNNESILVVDDSHRQLEIAKQILTALKYTVITAESGEQAVEFVKKQAVDLVILDMIMEPGMNGHETYTEIVKIHPGQKALVVSGFSESEDVRKTKELGARQYIRKPYTISQIGFAVKEIFQNESRSGQK